MTELQSERAANDPMWPTALVVFGIGLTAAWIGLLGYGLATLIERAI
jgi:hypothetical protein